MDTFSQLIKALNGAISSLVSVLIKIYFLIRIYWMTSKLPGPPLKLYNRVNYIKDFLNYCKKSEREFKVCQKFYMNLYPIVIVYSPEAIQDILSSKDKHNDKSSLLYHSFKPFLGDGLITSKGDKWYAHRKLLTPAFHFNILEGFFEIFKYKTKKYIEELYRSKLVDDFNDICPYTRRLTLSLICESAMGTFVGEEKDELEEVLDSVLMLEYIGTKRTTRPWLHIDSTYRMTAMFKQEEKYRKILHKFSNKLIKKRRVEINERLKKGGHEIKRRKEIFIDLLILMQLNGAQLSDDDIIDEVNTFIFAGFNTTQMAINYCLYLLGGHKDIQEKAMKEQKEIFGDSGRDPTMEDLSQMVYLDRCVKESLRLFPSVPIISRTLSEDQKLGDYWLSKGTDCLLMPYITHRIAENFPNPEEFNPDHFLPEKVLQRHAYSYFPFSAGPRNCLGKRFANIAEKTVLSWILRTFRIESEGTHNALKVSALAVLVPIGGLSVKLKPLNQT